MMERKGPGAPEKGLQPRLSFLTLGVADLERSRTFYTDVVGWTPLPSPPGVAFFELGKTWLSLYPRAELAADAQVPDAPPSAFPGFSMAYNVAGKEEVDAVLRGIAARGGRIVRAAHDAFWGGRSGYFADPDGYLWEVAWNPQFPHAG